MNAFLVAATIFFTPCVVFAGTPFIVTESAIPIDTKSYRAEGGMQFNKIPLGPRNAVFSFSFRYGLIHNMEIEAELPYLFANEGKKSRDQFGDLMLQTKVRFLKGREASPISVAGAMQVKVPSAPQNDLVHTTGEPDVGLSLIASKEIFPYRAHLNLSHIYIGKAGSPDRRDYSVGVEFITPRPHLSLTGELFGSDLTGDQWSVAGGASSQVLPQVTVDGMLGIGLSEGAPDYTFNLRASYFLQ